MRRDQTVYTCDGCHTTQAGELNTAPPGWHLVTTNGLRALPPNGETVQHHLCSGCYAGVEWILRFQGRIVPPPVIAQPKPITSRVGAPHADPSLDPTLECPAKAEHPMLEHCGLCGYEPQRPDDELHIILGTITVDTLPAKEWWIEPMRRTVFGNLHPRIQGTLRGHWPRLGRHQKRPGEKGPESITVVDLVETAAGGLHPWHNEGTTA